MCGFKVELPADAQPSFHRDALTVYHLVGRPETKTFSISLIVVNGINTRSMNGTTEAKYMVVGGVGYFTIWDGSYPRTVVARPGDTVRIPEGVMYQDVGADLVMICMNHPAFDPAHAKKWEE